MKILLIFLIAFSVSCNAKTKKPEVTTSKEKKEEDCDDKAKKVVEIKEESISLTGNTGCSLDEMNKDVPVKSSP